MNTARREWWFELPGLIVFMHPAGYLAFRSRFVPEESIECLNPCDLHKWA